MPSSNKPGARLKSVSPKGFAATLGTVNNHLPMREAFLGRKTGRVAADRPIPGWPLW